MKLRNVLLNTTLFATSLLSATFLQAQEIENTGNIYLGGVGYFSDSDRNIDDDIGFVIGGELPVSERWSIATDFYNVDTDTRVTNIDSDLDFYRLGLNYHFNQLNGWQPYVGFGFGNIEVDAPGSLLDEEEQTLDVGFGMKRRIGENWMLRGDYKLINGEDVHGFDNAISVGISYAFGSHASAPAAQPTATSPTMMDSDGDGVPDSSDACANTPAGVQVDSRGCEIDSDRDGVVDSRDNCPDTPANLAMDNNGCPILEASQRRIELLVNFDYDQSDVKPQYDSEIEDFADFMKIYGNTNAVIEGHTDSRGSDAYNQPLSERRANAVRDELVNEYDIDASRVSTVGYGESRPVATNDTDEGRAQNRRIEAVLSVEVEEQRRR